MQSFAGIFRWRFEWHKHPKNKIKKLGKIQALINYRNGLAHGFNQSKERAQKEYEEYYPLLEEILKEEKLHQQFKKQALERAKEFDIYKILPMYEALYEKALSNKK